MAVTTDAGLTCHNDIPAIDQGSELDDLDQAADACTSMVAAAPCVARQRGSKTVSRASDKNLAAIQDDMASHTASFDIGGDLVTASTKHRLIGEKLNVPHKFWDLKSKDTSECHVAGYIKDYPFTQGKRQALVILADDGEYYVAMESYAKSFISN